MSKVVDSINEALDGLETGMSIAVGGFGVCGNPFSLLRQIEKTEVLDLKIYSNNPGYQNDEGESFGIARLVKNDQVSSFHGSFIGMNKAFEKQFLTGGVEVELIPQGTLAERMRAGGAGVPAFYTPTGVGSAVAEGGVPMLHDENGNVVKYSEPKEVRVFPDRNGEDREYVLEPAITTDFSVLRAYKGDADGNVCFRLSAQNFNPVAGMCGGVTVVEVENLVEVGELNPDEIHLPGIFVNRIYELTPEEAVEKVIEAPPVKPGANPLEAVDSVPGEQAGWKRQEIAARAAEELSDGQYANLGIGLPTLVPDRVPEGRNVIFQSENGLLKTGATATLETMDPDLINAGKTAVTLLPGAATFRSDLSFAMIRGGHVDTTILGALQVSENGDIANWSIPGMKMNGMGGAMDLTQGARRVIAVMEHTSPKDGQPRLLKKCTFPLTAARAVDRIITSLGVFDVTGDGLVLVELAPNVSVDIVREKTDADFIVAAGLAEQIALNV